MRVKVECVPPLPLTKIWFIVPPVSTIHDLKDTLCSGLPALRDDQINAGDIALFLDGFELLDTTLIDVVRDGDLIKIKPNVAISGKRKAIDEDVGVPRKKPRHATTESTIVATAVSKSIKSPMQQPGLTETSSESSSSSDSDDDSEESSASDSESDSSSDASSSSSASSAPSVRPSTASSNRTTGLLRGATQAKAGVSDGQTHHRKSPAKNLVPPGQGKTSTHNRNLRRRKKKQFERQASQTEPANPNDIPLGQKSSSLMEVSLADETTTSSAQVTNNKSAPPTFMMASLSNKNKRRGFKQAMASTLPKKIIFAESDEPKEPESLIQDELPFSGELPAVISNTAPNLFPRLIPPSELQEQGKLPPNMFVTSIDVEEGMHPPRRKNKKKHPESYMSEVQEVEQVVLDYGFADDVITTQREEIVPLTDASGATEQDWSAVEAKWDSLPKLGNVSQVQSGTMVGWKALAINPATFTPEFLLNIGKVTKVDAKQLAVQPLHRPGAAGISFGGFVDEEDGEVQLDEETFEWNDIHAGEWRVIS